MTEPTLPLSEFCATLRKWLVVIRTNERRSEAMKPRMQVTADEINRVFISIEKSDLLHRMFCEGQEYRQVPCPLHAGHWSGIGDCKYGCDLTGWLPVKEERE